MSIVHVVDVFIERLNEFGGLMDRYVAYTASRVRDASEPTLSTRTLRQLLSEWFVCFLTLHDEYQALYVGDMRLARHRALHREYKHDRKEPPGTYKGKWQSKCSVDGINCELGRLSQRDLGKQSVENAISSFDNAVCGLNARNKQLKDSLSEVTTALSRLGAKDIDSSMVYPVESLRYKLTRGDKNLFFEAVRIPEVAAIDMSDLRSSLGDRKRKTIMVSETSSSPSTVSSLASRVCEGSRTVRVTLKPTPTPVVDESLNAIKRMYGADPGTLDAHREALEIETRLSNPAMAHALVKDPPARVSISAPSVQGLGQTNGVVLNKFEDGASNGNRRPTNMSNVPEPHPQGDTPDNDVCVEQQTVHWRTTTAEREAKYLASIPTHTDVLRGLLLYPRMTDSGSSDGSLERKSFEVDLTWQPKVAEMRYGNRLTRASSCLPVSISVSFLLRTICEQMWGVDNPVLHLPTSLQVIRSNNTSQNYAAADSCEMHELLSGGAVVEVHCCKSPVVCGCIARLGQHWLDLKASDPRVKAPSYGLLAQWESFLYQVQQRNCVEPTMTLCPFPGVPMSALRIYAVALLGITKEALSDCSGLVLHIRNTVFDW
eukprot:CAMPEP_0185040982 /NCGR_PEP_ID=MMETSP1103-20130426/39724_1 /TAXON_ID=36769 /ORGANISM="Paraphysomonas bandaiensis, Strain Caron Lab Isolate" /LENGTH=600 /DNA_ID=CAMNT_0027580529 /DNA_START=36 /DNA_END=1835 /DNA_ORIENTATION=-